MHGARRSRSARRRARRSRPARRSGPQPRIAISSTIASVPRSASRIVSGTPISVLRFSRFACVLSCARRIVARMSLVDVLPVEPVTPITRAFSSRRHARASDCSAASGSAAAITAPPVERLGVPRRDDHAPCARVECCLSELAAVGVLRPAGRRTGRPGPTSRESITARRGPPSAAESERPARALGNPGGITVDHRLDHPRAPRARPSRRRTAPCDRPRTPAPARAPCRRSPPRRPRAAPSTARAIARRRSTSRSAAPPVPANTWSTIASGSSERGLSDVTIARSASSLATRPISGRFD